MALVESAWPDAVPVATDMTVSTSSHTTPALRKAVSLDWRLGAESGVPYGVPRGLTMKNTFLEFACNGIKDLCQNDREGAEVSEAVDLGSSMKRRTTSCPPAPSWSESTKTPPLGDVLGDLGSAEGALRNEQMASPGIPSWRTRSESEQDSVNWRLEGSGLSERCVSSRDRQRQRRGHDRMSTSLVLRGLPFNTTEGEILAFLKKQGVPADSLASDTQVTLLSNAQGRASGFAEIHLALGSDAQDVRQKVHLQHLGGRYVEALPSRNSKQMGDWPQRNHRARR